MNIFHGKITQKGGDLIFSGPCAINLGKRFNYEGKETVVHLGIRPEDMQILKSSGADSIPGKVNLVEPIGSDTLINVEVAEGVSCKIREAALYQIVEGDNVNIKIPPEKVHLFDDDGIRIPSKEV